MSAMVAAATREVFGLAESPVWDASRNRLLWVDIPVGLIYEGELDDSTGQISIVRELALPGMVGAVAPTGDSTVLVAAQERIVIMDADGTCREGPRIVPRGDDRRCNDGGTDPAGRFLVGTLSLAGPSDREILVRWEPDGRLTVIDDDLRLSNGIAWSTDGRTMYNVDSFRHTVFARSYDPTGEAIGPRHVHLTVEDGIPDGIATDAEDHLWVAVWGAGEVRRYTPDARIDSRVAVPAPHTSSVTLAGTDRRTLVISTAAQELTAEQRTAHPMAGHLFTTRVPTPGLPTVPWAGVTSVRPIRLINSD